MFLGDEANFNVPLGNSNDVKVMPSSGLRNRKQLQPRSGGAGSTPLHHSDEETSGSFGSEGPEHNQLVVNHHYPQVSTMHDGGWIARIAAILVGDDPSQSYALICGNCHMHNGESIRKDIPTKINCVVFHMLPLNGESISYATTYSLTMKSHARPQNQLCCL